MKWLRETTDQAKKFRLARRVAYFACFWPTERRHFDGTLPAYQYLALPLGGKNGELASRIRAVESGEAPPECSWFFDVLHLYDARSSLVHDGWLDRGPGGRDLSTWFIGAVLLRPLLTWFATNPSGDLCQLDNEISALAGTAGG
jgi:hypothetical protein